MYHHPLSTPHLLLTIPQDPTYSKGFGSIMLSVTQLESLPQVPSGVVSTHRLHGHAGRADGPDGMESRGRPFSVAGRGYHEKPRC